MIDWNAVSMSEAPNRYLIGVPFFVLVALVLPLFLLLAPVIFFASAAVRVNPFDAMRVVWGLVRALRGTEVEVAGRGRSVLVHLY